MSQAELAAGVHADQLAQVEEDAATDATDGLGAELAAVLAAATAAWVTAAESVSALAAPARAAAIGSRVGAELARVLDGSRRRARLVAAGSVVQAYRLGVAQAGAEVTAAVAELTPARVRVDVPAVQVPPRPDRPRVPARPPRPAPEPAAAHDDDDGGGELPDVDIDDPPAEDTIVRLDVWARTVLDGLDDIDDSPPDDLVDEVAGRVDEVHRDRAEQARETLRGTDTVGFPAVAAAVRHAQSAGAGTERVVRTAVNDAAGQGAEQVAETLGVGRVWIAERTGCRHCLAYSGQTVEPGEQFPGGLSFDVRPFSTAALDGPPLHPNCRCRTSPWSWAWPRPPDGSITMPTALRREAQRSILRGHALPSEPRSARIRAADRLLDAGPPLPRSVLAAAERAVAAGRFPPVPAGL
ncbi:structural protein [Parafrankia discariae]|uniref:hypothetical protein n=1 Tax=Parafrankia discariae TaxID=365528 RepID=UPI000372F5BC|nr:hypothetical protein [Parafrankia discariae]